MSARGRAPVSPWHARRRTEIAVAIETAVVVKMGIATAEQARTMTAAQRDQAVRLAGLTRASDEAWAQVLALMADADASPARRGT